MRFCVIGPAYPFRGGIAHHTSLLCRHLSVRHEVSAVTFGRLYPSVFFPGKSQVDPSAAAEKFAAVPLIDSLNPFTWMRAGDYVHSLRPDCVLVQWWQPFFAPCLTSIVVRARPARTLFICHNVLPHEGNPLAKLLARRALGQGDGFIVHSEEERRTLNRLLPGSHIEKTVLPEYQLFPREGISKQDARERLGLDGRVILFFGLVRKYKGLLNLIHAMSSLKDAGITCLVVGEFYDKREKYVSEIRRLALNRHVRIVDEYVPNEEVEPYFAAADIVVLPYVSATQSSIVQMAYRFERPVIATAVGGLPEAVDHERTGLLVPPGDSEALAKAIRRYYDEDMESAMVKAICEDKGRFSWDRVIETIESMGLSP